MGSVVISLDAELAWGFHGRDPLPVARLRRARDAWRHLCDLFDRLELPATWAVVGHLFLEECESVHPDHPAGGQCCETPAEAADELWFAGGLVDRIRNADVDHEVGGHSFTHVRFDRPGVSRSDAAREVRSSRTAMRDRGVAPTSFVFPVNRIRYRELLAEHGFDCYRGRRSEQPGRVRKLAGALLGRGAPPLVEPSVDRYGLVNVPASLYLYGFEGLPGSVVDRVRGDPVVSAAKRGLERAARTDGVLHLWFHPHNAIRVPAFQRLRAILSHVARRRDRGEVRVETMHDVATRATGGDP